jgi:AmmeMemoRadiSam system protein A
MNPFVDLAKKSVETFIKEDKKIKVPENLPQKLLNQKGGVFVTIEKNKNLRACIGTYLPTQSNLAEEIISNAISAATEDYRFGSVKKEELPELSYTVYLLKKPELIKNIKELNPKKYGIMIKTADYPLKSALLLPNLEGIDTINKQISIACQKGDINPEKEKILIYKFEVEKYEQ